MTNPTPADPDKDFAAMPAYIMGRMDALLRPHVRATRTAPSSADGHAVPLGHEPALDATAALSRRLDDAEGAIAALHDQLTATNLRCDWLQRMYVDCLENVVTHDKASDGAPDASAVHARIDTAFSSIDALYRDVDVIFDRMKRIGDMLK
jgi:hypothetical protein